MDYDFDAALSRMSKTHIKTKSSIYYRTTFSCVVLYSLVPIHRNAPAPRILPAAAQYDNFG